jgi:hypothetical protein
MGALNQTPKDMLNRGRNQNWSVKYTANYMPREGDRSTIFRRLSLASLSFCFCYLLLGLFHIYLSASMAMNLITLMARQMTDFLRAHRQQPQPQVSAQGGGLQRYPQEQTAWEAQAQAQLQLQQRHEIPAQLQASALAQAQGGGPKCVSVPFASIFTFPSFSSSILQYLFMRSLTC